MAKPEVNDSVSMDDVNDSSMMELNVYLVATALVAAISAFNAGINSAVANIPEKTIRVCPDPVMINGLPSCINADEVTWGIVIAMFALGGGFGSLGAGRVLDKLGRRKTLMANNILFIIGGILIATATELVQMSFGRFIVGAGSGLATVAVSTYIGEISPSRGRGALGTSLQLMMVLGILVGQAISLPLNSPSLWRYLFALTVLPSLVQIVLLYFCVESPRYLISRHNLEHARVVFTKLRKGYNIDTEFNAIVEGQRGDPKDKEELGVSASSQQEGMIGALKALYNDPVQLKYLIMALILHASQQLSGINGVIQYSTAIFEVTFGSEQATYATVGVGALNLVVTIISIFIIDRAGRKILLIISLIGMSIFSALIVIGSLFQFNYLVIISVMLFVGSFAIGLGSIPWLIISELFPTRTVSAASALCMAVNWFANFGVSLLFPKLLSQLGDYTFIVFASITLASAFFVLTWVPETKGRSVEDLLGVSDFH